MINLSMNINAEYVLLDVIDVFSPIASEKYSEDRKDGEQIERVINKIIQLAGFVPVGYDDHYEVEGRAVVAWSPSKEVAITYDGLGARCHKLSLEEIGTVFGRS